MSSQHSRSRDDNRNYIQSLPKKILEKNPNWLVLFYKSDLCVHYISSSLTKLSDQIIDRFFIGQMIWAILLPWISGKQKDDPVNLAWIRNVQQHPCCTAILVQFTQVDSLLQKAEKTPKCVLRLHKCRLALFSLNLYLLRSSSLPHQKMLLKTTTSLSASLSARQDSVCFLKRPPNSSLWRNWWCSCFKLYIRWDQI